MTIGAGGSVVFDVCHGVSIRQEGGFEEKSCRQNMFYVLKKCGRFYAKEERFLRLIKFSKCNQTSENIEIFHENCFVKTNPKLTMMFDEGRKIPQN